MAINLFDHVISLNKASDKVGFIWENVDQIFEKIHSEYLEVKEALLQEEGPFHLTEEIGDLLFSVISLDYFLKIDPKQAFKVGINKYEQRFNVVLKILEEKDIASANNLSTEFLLEIWKEAKKRINKYGAAGED